MKLWKNEPSNIGAVQEYKPKRSFQSFGQSMSTRIVKLPDGSVEQHKTVRDSEGNEEITVTRQIGDKKYTVVTKKDKTGAETKIEDLYNMDESKFKKSNFRIWYTLQIVHFVEKIVYVINYFSLFR